MKAFVIAAALFAGSQNVHSEEVFCTVKVNLETVAETQFNIGATERLMYVQAEDFAFYLANKGQSKFELEVFDGSVPSRSYAQGVLRALTDELTWTLWSRDILLETSCKLVQK